MDLLSKTLFLCLALALSNGAPTHPHGTPVEVSEDADPSLPDRCEGLEFDAIVPDEKGNTFFFKGSHLWKGFNGPARLSNEFFKELDDLHNIGHVDAAFRMHNPDNTDDHDHIYFFLDDKVFSYYNQSLEDGYPKAIQEDFPGIPSHLDAAVECPKGECTADSVLFFKGDEVHVYDIHTKTVKTKTWPQVPTCTSAFRWLEHYYCFHGHNFTRFHPVTGEVTGAYPKDARNYFMRCANFGHGSGSKPIKCSDVKLDAITTDDSGKTYLFKDHNYMRLDTRRDGLHAFPINRTWHEITSGVDAVFSYDNKMYIIKGDQVYIYKSGAHYILVDGYPKSLQEELGINITGPVDAAFVCPDNPDSSAYIIEGEFLFQVELTPTPRRIVLLPNFKIDGIDAAHCDSEGVTIFKGSKFYKYPKELAWDESSPPAQSITSAKFGCQD